MKKTILLFCLFTSGIAFAVSPEGWKLSKPIPGNFSSCMQQLTEATKKEEKSMPKFAKQLLGVETTATIEIKSLARALQHDPKLIYEFVHNHIDYVPYYGSLKGATLTLLERSGNDFDQSSLMIALLRESGFDAEYRIGGMRIPNFGDVNGYDMASWLGVNSDTNIIKFFLKYAIPANVYADETLLQRCWVKAVINGTNYEFDPAFKVYHEITGVNVKDLMNFDRNQLRNAAGGQVGSSYIKDMNENNLHAKLDEFTMNLVNNLRTQYPNSNMKQIIGGREIIPEYLTEYSTTLKFPTEDEFTFYDLPSFLMNLLTVKYVGIEKLIPISSIE